MISREVEIPAVVDIEFDAGAPVAINGVPMQLAELIESVATIAGSHGIAPTAADALVAECALPVGVVRVQLFQGDHTIISR